MNDQTFIDECRLRESAAPLHDRNPAPRSQLLHDEAMRLIRLAEECLLRRTSMAAAAESEGAGPRGQIVAAGLGQGGEYFAQIEFTTEEECRAAGALMFLDVEIAAIGESNGVASTNGEQGP